MSKKRKSAITACLLLTGFVLLGCGNIEHTTGQCLGDGCNTNYNAMCNELVYDTETQFCSNGNVYSKCNGLDYNPETQSCSTGRINGKCAGRDYNQSESFCFDSRVYSRCGGRDYNPSESFCFSNRVYSKCGGRDYDPSDPSVLSCQDGRLVGQCNGQAYNPDTRKCRNGTLYDLFVDSRDGQSYAIITIGGRIWMAENLNFEYKIQGASQGNYCYNNSADSCAKYGRLYTWAAAMDSAGATGCGSGKKCTYTGMRGVCPDGWHLPTRAEWSALFSAVGLQSTGETLKARSGWNDYGYGSDTYGFAALPAGLRSNGGDFYGAGGYAFFWSSSESDADFAYDMELKYDSDGADLNGNYKGYGFAVRCLKKPSN